MGVAVRKSFGSVVRAAGCWLAYLLGRKAELGGGGGRGLGRRGEGLHTPCKSPMRFCVFAPLQLSQFYVPSYRSLAVRSTVSPRGYEYIYIYILCIPSRRWTRPLAEGVLGDRLMGSCGACFSISWGLPATTPFLAFTTLLTRWSGLPFRY